MKKILVFLASFAVLTAAPLSSEATLFFEDFFFNGSTLTNAVNATPTTNSTSYQLSSSKAVTSTNALPDFLKYGIAATTGGGVEAQALFTTNPVSLSTIGDYVRM